jgi:hypothetical protein
VWGPTEKKRALRWESRRIGGATGGKASRQRLFPSEYL